MAEITAVDAVAKIVTAQSRLDGAVISNIPLDGPLHRQYIPVIGQQVLLLRLGEYGTRILAEFGERVFNPPIQPGEVMMEGAGGGIVYLNQGGDVLLADNVLSNVIRLISAVGIQINGDALSIDIKGTGKIKILDDKIEVIKTTGEDEEVKSKITLTDDKVSIESDSVEIGDNPLGGVVYSLSNVPGDYSFDTITGRPIPGSTKHKTSPSI
jgi:hypothetical protein